MWLPTTKQVDTFKRYATAIAGTGFVASWLAGKGYSVVQVTDLISQLGSFANTVVNALAAGAALYAVVRGVNAASPTSQIASVSAIAQDPTSSNSTAAKVALLDATASLPEVTKPIPVTDQGLVDATQSPLITKGG